MITVQGFVPYPPQANAAPIQRLASDLTRLCQGLQQGSAQLTGTAGAARSSWVGQAADAFASHVDDRAKTVQMTGQTLARTVPVLQTYAAAITATSAAYSTAATAEHVARAGMPWTFAALGAAIAAEGVALTALQTAGLACAGALVAIEIELAAVHLFGVNREAFTAIKETATQIWDGIVELGSELDADAAIALLNTTITIPNGDGSSTRTSALGWLLGQNEHVQTLVGTVQALVGIGTLLSAPPLSAVERPELASQVLPAGMTGSPNAAQVGQIMANLEALQRRGSVEADQSVAVLATQGTGPDGAQVLNLTLPGMLPPNEAVWGSSGTRNLPNAAADQITGYGNETLAIRQFIESRGLRPGSIVNLYGHSQGGIVARNVANDLINDGYRVNVVSYGSPDDQLRPGIGSYAVQNLRDPVPAARVGGDSMVSTTLHPGQHLVTFDREVDGDLFASHDARVYGNVLAERPNTAGARALNSFLDGQRQVTIDPARTTVVTFEGPCRPDGVCDAVPVPSSAYRVGSGN